MILRIIRLTILKIFLKADKKIIQEVTIRYTSLPLRIKSYFDLSSDVHRFRSGNGIHTNLRGME